MAMIYFLFLLVAGGRSGVGRPLELAVRVPDKEAQERRERVQREAKERGRPVSQKKLDLCDGNILVTNAPAELLGVFEVEAVRRVRWQVELFFKELKSVLGMIDYRFRDFERVERWVDVALATFLYLEAYRQRHLQRPGLSPKERVVWETARTAGLVQAVRAEVEQGELAWVARRLRTPGGCRRLRHVVQAAGLGQKHRAG